MEEQEEVDKQENKVEEVRKETEEEVPFERSSI